MGTIFTLNIGKPKLLTTLLKLKKNIILLPVDMSKLPVLLDKGQKM